jgi:hypothetical protein
MSEPAPSPSPPSPAPVSPARQRGHAQKSADGKWLPTGDKGFAAPPVEHRFRKGGRGGPGRPRGSVSTDTLWRKELDARRTVKIDGRTVKVATRELLIKSEIKDSLMGVRTARKAALETAARLYQPPPESNEAETAAHHVLDQLVLREFLGGLSLGEAASGDADLLSDALVAPFGGDDEPDAAWNEGDWSDPGEAAPDDE